MKYQPNYAKGEILVEFKGSQSRDFARAFGQRLGYTLKDEDYQHGNAFIYIVPENREKNVSKQFEKHKEFIEWASHRDIKLEQRWAGLGKVITRLQALSDCVEDYSDSEWNRILECIANCLKSEKYDTPKVKRKGKV